MVQRALDSTTDVSGDDESAIDQEPQPPTARRDANPGRPSLRLAFATEPIAPPEDVVTKRAAKLRSLDPPVTRASRNTIVASAPDRAAPVDEPDDAILVVEDEPASVSRSQSGVRREEYRQLFSRLMHGT
jgi:hypothetical protein